MNATQKSKLPERLGSGVCLALRFSSCDERAELLATYFRDKLSNEVVAGRLELGYWGKSLRALCIALLLAKVARYNSMDGEGSEFELASTDQKETWIWRLAQSLEKQHSRPTGWVGFG